MNPQTQIINILFEQLEIVQARKRKRVYLVWLFAAGLVAFSLIYYFVRNATPTKLMLEISTILFGLTVIYLGIRYFFYTYLPYRKIKRKTERYFEGNFRSIKNYELLKISTDNHLSYFIRFTTGTEHLLLEVEYFNTNLTKDIHTYAPWIILVDSTEQASKKSL